jgi:MarR family transcriptional regulator, transcriptional regulator for hemolysin
MQATIRHIIDLQAEFSEELAKVSRKIRTSFDSRARARGLTLSRSRMLILLSKKDRVTQTELAEALEVEGPTLVRLLDGVEKQGLIKRVPVEGDRRAKHITLTPLGQESAALVSDLVDEYRRDLLKDVSEEDMEIAIRVFRAMERNIEAAS